MISQEKRTAIVQMHQQGISKRAIAKQLRVSRNSVKEIIEAEGALPNKKRSDAIEVDEDLLREIYRDCNGWVQRVHEILAEREKIDIGYSTLTRKLRDLGIGTKNKARCDSVPDSPGDEMQHDTTVYTIEVGGKRVKVIASLIYFRYSKVRYLKLYRRFNRFKMKCFFHEALTYFGYCASTCIIDNTNLGRLSGSGKDAIIAPEMEHFGKHYGFYFQCHALNHPNRKAGNERGFYTTESNFLPGRSFDSMEDLNAQALEWATVRMFHKAVGKAEIIPAKAFEHEKSFLNPLPAFVQAPYLEHNRKTDQYGFAAFAANYYWIPGSDRQDITLLEFDNHLEIYLRRELLAKYEIATEGVRNEVFSNGHSTKPKHRPNDRKRPTASEEKKLRGLSQVVDSWLTGALKGKGNQRHRFIRSLYGLYRKITPSLFIQAVERASKYGITDLKHLESTAEHLLKNENYVMPDPELNETFKTRKSFLDGFSCDEVDLSQYDDFINRGE